MLNLDFTALMGCIRELGQYKNNGDKELNKGIESLQGYDCCPVVDLAGDAYKNAVCTSFIMHLRTVEDLLRVWTNTREKLQKNDNEIVKGELKRDCNIQLWKLSKHLKRKWIFAPGVIELLENQIKSGLTQTAKDTYKEMLKCVGVLKKKFKSVTKKASNTKSSRFLYADTDELIECCLDLKVHIDDVLRSFQPIMDRFDKKPHWPENATDKPVTGAVPNDAGTAQTQVDYIKYLKGSLRN